MARYKEYTNDQYLAFFKQPFNSNFGRTEAYMAHWFVTQPGNAHFLRNYGVTESNMLSTYIPFLKAHLKGGFFMFLAVATAEGGGAGNWINHFGADTSSTPLGCMSDDTQYICSIIVNMNTHPDFTAHEVEGGAPYVEDSPGSTSSALRACGDWTIGRYYIPSTMAGNSWVFGTAWSEAHWTGYAPGVYYNNPYDTIIDEIKKAGADPFGKNTADSSGVGDSGKNQSSGGSSGPTWMIIKPGKFYLCNGTARQLGSPIKLRRYGDFLDFNYDTNGGADASNGQVKADHDEKQAGSGGMSSKLDDVFKQVATFGGKYIPYANVRPQPNPHVCGYADCSGFLCWCWRNVCPGMWNGGFCNTATMYAYLAKWRVYAGTMKGFIASGWDQKVLKGDIIIMGKTPLTNAGNLQHTGFMGGNTNQGAFINQHGSGTNYTESLEKTMEGYEYEYGDWPYWDVYRVK